MIAFLQGLVFYGPIATIFRQSRGLSMFEIFLLASVLMIMMIAFEIPWGYFADRYGYKRTLLLSYFIFFLSKVIFYQSHSFPMFLAETILMSFALSGISGCVSTLLYSSADEEGSDRAFSLFNASGAAGFLMTSFLSTFTIGKSVDKATLLSVYAMTGDIVASVTNLSIGRAADISLITALLLCGILSGLAYLLAVIYFRSVNSPG